MDKQLSVVGALTQWLFKEHRSPVVTLYDIGYATVKIYNAREYAGQKVKNIRAAFPRRESTTAYRNELTELGILEPRRDLPTDMSLLVSSPFKDPFDLACGIDPFCYISHLSAMEYHGLTDRFAKTIFATTLPTPQWKIRATEKMKKDLGPELFASFLEANFAPLARRVVPSINKNPLNMLTSKFADQGAYIVPSDRPIRVASLGRTFVDMLRKPGLCGGMKHVLDVYREHANIYLPLIISEVDRHGDKIEKVRAGYILEERCGIKNNATIASWVQFAQRGGSRVLDPDEAYWPTFSEKWCLSINVPKEINE
jgi:hypothetical protein